MLSPDDRLKADLQLNLYNKAQGEFGNLMTKRSRMLRALAKWLEQFGHKTPALSGFAIQVLSLTCSASGCERNSSTFVDKIDSIVVDEIHSDDEWITGKEDLVLPEGSRWLENDELFSGYLIMTVPSDPFDSRGKEKQVRVVGLVDEDVEIKQHVSVDPQIFDSATFP
ncbi:hypothetical protein OROMI_000873 [Orobanche minor]